MTAARSTASAGTRPRVRSSRGLGSPVAWWRDVWCWAAMSTVLVLVAHSLGAPLGEPVAEDFDFLHRALLGANHTLLDGGGSVAFWRPVSHQLYYLALGRVMLAEPRVVAALHALLMVLAVWLVYRGLRNSLSAPVAAVAASFPVLAESTRTVLSWPSQFVDLGLWVFTAWALYETSRGRLWRALLALVLALGSKELAVVAAVLLPWMPGERSKSERMRWAFAMGGVAAVWAALYLWVRHTTHLELPHHLEHSAEVAQATAVARYQWAWWNSVRAMMSLPLIKTTYEGSLWLALGVLSVITLIVLAVRQAWRRRAQEWQWVAWGLTWFAMSSATLVVIYPLWQPNRSGYGSLGAGVAAAALFELASPVVLALLVAVRIVAFAAAPGPPDTVSSAASETGAFMDFNRLVRLQRLMEAVRLALTRAHPTLPRGAVVVEQYPLRMAEYAFGGSLALQCWYRDSTVRWVRFEDFQSDTSMSPAALVEFQSDRVPIAVLIDPHAMRLVDHASVQLLRGDFYGTLATLAAVDAIPIDPGAGIMRSMIETRRGVALAGLHRMSEAEQSARIAIATWNGNPNARYWLGYALAAQGRLAEAEIALDSALVHVPADTAAISLRERVRAERVRAQH